MTLIRAFETRVAALYRDGEIPGFVHVSLGQEAVAAGVCGALHREDYVATTHRGHGHCIAKGADVDAMMAELFGRAAGLCRGKGGSMHVADPSLGILGANGIVGAGIPITVGAGLAIQQLEQDRVAVCFLGEGAINQGAFHEGVNLAAIWDLPVLLVCENNLYAEFTDSRTMTRATEVTDRAAVYGIRVQSVDGNDAEAVHAAALDALEHCRGGKGPFFLEAKTYRQHGHYEGDGQPYKPDVESDEWRSRDPVAALEERLVHRGEATPSDLAAVHEEAVARVEAAVAFARAAEAPAYEEAFAHVLVA